MWRPSLTPVPRGSPCQGTWACSQRRRCALSSVAVRERERGREREGGRERERETLLGKQKRTRCFLQKQKRHNKRDNNRGPEGRALKPSFQPPAPLARALSVLLHPPLSPTLSQNQSRHRHQDQRARQSRHHSPHLSYHLPPPPLLVTDLATHKHFPHPAPALPRALPSRGLMYSLSPPLSCNLL